MELKFQGNTSVSIKADFITVLIGTGEFQANDGEVFKIHNIKIPMMADGKHIAVFDKEFADESVVMDMSYDDGKILNFTCEKVEHWHLNKI